MADFKNRRQFEAWLENQPLEVAIALAARVALRVLPVVQTAKGYKGCLVLPVFRATAVSWSKAKYPAHETELVDYAATAYVSAVAAAAAVRTADAYAAVAATRATAASARAAAARADDSYAAIAAFRAAAYAAAFAEDANNAAAYTDARSYAVAVRNADAATIASAAAFAGNATSRFFWSALSTDATRAEKGKKTCAIAGFGLAVNQTSSTLYGRN